MKTNNAKTNNMENTDRKKAIAWVRCSTDRQHTTGQQFEEIVKLAANDGLTRDDLIKIGTEGASAIKVDNTYKADLDRMYSLMDSGVISTVYAWAVDRVGRDQKENTFFKYKLLDCGIAIKTVEGVEFNPSDDNDPFKAVILDLKQRIAEDEMKKKIDRFRIGKNTNRAMGAYTGGKVLYGYQLEVRKVGGNDKKFYIEHPVNADIVRRIYNEYTNNTNTSARSIATQLYKEGIVTHAHPKSREMFVLKILRCKYYAGENVTTYPQLIMRDQYDAAQTKLNASKRLPRNNKNQSVVSYCHGLLRVKNELAKNGYYQMQVRRCDAQYIDPNTLMTIDADIADSVVLSSLGWYIDEFAEADTATRSQELMAKAREQETIKDTAIARIEAIKQNTDRLEERYIKGRISEEKLEALRAELDAEDKAQRETLDEAIATVTAIEDELEAMASGQHINVGDLDDTQRVELINKYIKYIEIERVRNSWYTMTIQFKMMDEPVKYELMTKKHICNRVYDDPVTGEHAVIPFNGMLLNRYDKTRRQSRKSTPKATKKAA